MESDEDTTAEAQPHAGARAPMEVSPGKEAPAMTGSFLVPIITPIVAIIALAFWLGMIFWAEGHPGWKAHRAAHEYQFPGESLTLAGDLDRGELAAPQQEAKAA